MTRTVKSREPRRVRIKVYGLCSLPPGISVQVFPENRRRSLSVSYLPAWNRPQGKAGGVFGGRWTEQKKMVEDRRDEYGDPSRRLEFAGYGILCATDP